jgi:hypothetical protein
MKEREIIRNGSVQISAGPLFIYLFMDSQILLELGFGCRLVSSEFFSPTLAHCHKQLCFKPILCLEQSARFKQNWQYHV